MRKWDCLLWKENHSHPHPHVKGTCGNEFANKLKQKLSTGREWRKRKSHKKETEKLDRGRERKWDNYEEKTWDEDR